MLDVVIWLRRQNFYSSKKEKLKLMFTAGVTNYHSAATPLLFNCFSAASFPFNDSSLLGA